MFITGEKLQNLCEYYIGYTHDFNFNPYIRNQTSKHIHINNYNIEHISNLEIKNIFCYTHIINNESDNQNLINILSNINTTFNLVLHNSDGYFSNSHIILLNIPNLQKIYTQNLSIDPTEQIIPLPIGIANSMWKHGNLNIWNETLLNHNFNKKMNFIYFNFNINTNLTKRQECYNIIKSKNIQNQPNLDYSSYVRLLSSYKFAICPEGNGQDTHRFWECLYLQVIPICVKNNITEYFSKYFPIVLVDNYNQLDITTLDNVFTRADWHNYHMLDFKYYQEFILQNE